MLKLNNVNFKFDKSGACFFNNLSASFNRGKINFIQGANGSGKSTLFRILQGKLSSNEFLKGDFCLDEKYDNISHRIAMVQQKFDVMLADKFSFSENLKFANISRYPSLKFLPNHKDVEEFLKQFSIDKNKTVNLLSGGQRQILAILMVLQKMPKVLLLDEPTSALDVENSKMVMDFINDLVKTTNIIVIMICHDKELVESYCNSEYYHLGHDLISDGRFIEVKKI